MAFLRSRFVASCIAMVLIVPGVLLDILPDAVPQWLAIGGYAALVFAAEYMFVLAPDTRFQQIQIPVLDFLFNQQFRSWNNSLKANERLPFRVVVLAERFTVLRLRTLQAKELRIVYGYNLLRTDPDYALTFGKEQGLCGQVLKSGDIGWFDRRDQTDDQFSLSPPQKDATKSLIAILSFPIKRDNCRSSHAVFCIDALTDDAADELKDWKNNLKAHNNIQLADLAEVVRVFF